MKTEANPLLIPSQEGYDYNFTLRVLGYRLLRAITGSNLYPRSCNHKRVSLYYLVVSLTFGISGTILSLMMRFELDSSSNRILTYENINFYLLAITLHGLIMIFFLVMPTLIGAYGNYLVPVYLGASEVVYPRINNLSVLIMPTSYTILIGCLITEYGIGIGWTLYPPLSTSIMTLTTVGIDLILYSLLVTGISSTLTSVNFIVTLHIWKSTIIPLSSMDIYVWSLVLVGYLLIVVLPILGGSLLMILCDLHYNTIFFDPLYGGDPVFYQHVFWYFGHPEVYILIVPGFGLISNVLSELISVILFGSQSMILAMISIAYLGSLVWSHHMFTVGLEIDSRAYFMSLTLLISIPTASKIFNWLSTYLNSYNNIYSLLLIYIKMFMLMFTLGGSSGLILSNTVIDISLHDTYYVVSHFHVVLSLGSILSLILGIIAYQEYLLLLIISVTNVLSLYHLTSIFIGIFVTFMPMHLLSFNTLPRRISDFPDSLNSWNTLITLGSSIT
jgi:cytochrome c oxidase subunit 1